MWSQFEVKQPSQILLSVLYNSILVGYGGLVNINWFDQKSEVSFLLKPDFENSEKLKGYIFPIFLQLIANLAFQNLGLNKIWTETYCSRKQHIKF